MQRVTSSVVTSLMFLSVCRCLTPILLFTNTLLTGSSDLQPVGRAYALVHPPSSRSPVPIPEPIKSKEEQVEVIKVGVAVQPHSCNSCV